MGWLRILTPGFEPIAFELPEGVVTLGRRADNPLCLAHDTVSGRHCDLAEADGLLTILDHGSTNGTFIRGERIEQGTVAPGETFQLGGVELCYEVEAPAGVSALASDEALPAEAQPTPEPEADHTTIYTQEPANAPAPKPVSTALKFTRGDRRSAESPEAAGPEAVDLDFTPTISMPPSASTPAGRPRSFALKFTAGDHRSAGSSAAPASESPAPPPASS
ncbi:MAG: FHA domain-containing protein [Limisphaerales bacterium]